MPRENETSWRNVVNRWVRVWSMIVLVATIAACGGATTSGAPLDSTEDLNSPGESIPSEESSRPSFPFDGTESELTTDEKTQIIASQLFCPVCQTNVRLNEVQDVPLAEEMRRSIHQLILEGTSKDDIIQFFVERYGESILYVEDLGLEINVTAHQWWWEFEYLDADGKGTRITIADELRVPLSRPIKLNLTSADVIHSFWVPQLAGKIDVVPGRSNGLWFKVEKTGTFLGQCATLCGISHDLHRLQVVVLEQLEYDAWVANYVESSLPNAPTPVPTPTPPPQSSPGY